jgi:hypothetical protein
MIGWGVLLAACLSANSLFQSIGNAEGIWNFEVIWGNRPIRMSGGKPARLRKEDCRLRMERELFKKATVECRTRFAFI